MEALTWQGHKNVNVETAADTRIKVASTCVGVPFTSCPAQSGRMPGPTDTFAAAPSTHTVPHPNRDEFISALFDEYGALVFGIARRVTGTAEDAEEICQDVFVAFWRGDRYDPTRGSIKTWLTMRAHSQAVDKVRSEAAWNRRNTPAETEPRRDPIDVHISQSHAASEVRRAFATLSPIQREAIDLAYFSGFTQTQIALHLELPLGTVKSRVRQALQLMARALSAPPATRTASALVGSSV